MGIVNIVPIQDFFLGAFEKIQAYALPIVAAVSFAFGMYFHSLLVDAEKLGAAEKVIDDTKTNIAEDSKKELARAVNTEKRLTKEKALTNDLEKAIAKEPDQYRGLIPADSVRILNSY